VLEASAGTGKTYALEHLVLELVLVTDVKIDQILVVTFTEKATQELRVRVRGRLAELLRACDGGAPGAGPGEDAWTLDGGARRKLQRALHAFDGATITTIHAFCQRVLRENAFWSGRLFEESQVDGRDSFGRAMRTALRRDIATDPVRGKWLEAALRAGYSVGAIEDLLWAAQDARGELRPFVDPAKLQAELDAFPIDDASRIDGRDVLKSWGVQANTAKATASHIYEIAMAVDRARDGGPTAFLVEVDDKNLEYLRKNPPPDGRPGPTGRACAAARRLVEMTPTLQAGLANVLLPPVREELIRRKRQIGQYDFDDMLSLVHEGLHGSRGDALRRALRDRYRFVLIDEFQDTDETQWEIFREAFFADVPDLPRSVLTLVGDPKQSIYRFRGADVQTYLRARDEVVASGGATLRLEQNFRATPPVIDACNALFGGSSGEPFFTGANAFTPVTPGRPDRTLVDGAGDAVTPMHAFRFEREISLAMLGPLVAREIERILDPARPWRLDDRPLEPQDVFVLTRTKGEGRILSASLRAAGIPFAFFKEDGLLQTDEAREIRTLLAAIVEPDDRSLRVSAWMTRFFALPLEDLERARALPVSHPYVARLERWKALGDARDFEGLFESIVQDSGIVRREIFFGDGERVLTNTLHVFELLLEHARREPGTLRDLSMLLGRLVDQAQLPLDWEGNVQRLESERRAVQIMTIHKSKGLEAPVVFLAGGWSPGRIDEVRVLHQDGKRVGWVGKLRPDVKEAVDAEEREEDERLMYVALTRAMGRLYLPFAVTEGGRRGRRTAYDPVQRRLAHLVATDHPGISVEDATPRPDLRLVAANDTTRPWVPPATLTAPARSEEPFTKLREDRRGDVVTSYTRLRSTRHEPSPWSEDAVDRREEKVVDEVGDPGIAELRPARASGVFVHEVLERVPLASFAGTDLASWRARTEVQAIFEDARRVHGVDPAQRPHAEQLVWTGFTTPIDLPAATSARPKLSGIASSESVGREVDFVFHLPGSFVRGSLDVAFQHEGLTYFADWKTDSLATYAPEVVERHVLGHYLDQVRIYAVATLKLLGIASRAAYDQRFGGILYVFLRGMDATGRGLWSTRPTWDEVTAWEQDLQRRARGTR
jgi:exodeoxyribonuclease V beta subunit